MARKPNQKILENSRLLKDYASWIYCTNCNKTVAYLCYVTYDLFDFKYTCACGSEGRVYIEFEHGESKVHDKPLKIIKNRLCCPNDDSPLLSIVDKNVDKYDFDITCNMCNSNYKVCKE